MTELCDWSHFIWEDFLWGVVSCLLWLEIGAVHRPVERRGVRSSLLGLSRALCCHSSPTRPLSRGAALSCGSHILRQLLGSSAALHSLLLALPGFSHLSQSTAICLALPVRWEGTLAQHSFRCEQRSGRLGCSRWPRYCLKILVTIELTEQGGARK